MFNRCTYKLVVLMVCIISGFMWWLWRTGEFMKGDGNLVVSMSIINDPIYGSKNDSREVFIKNLALYSINFDNQEKIEKYFMSEQYGEINFPYQRDKDFVCTAKNIDKNYYTVLLIKDERVRELMKLDHLIQDPVLINNDEDIIFNLKNKERYGLYKYNIISKQIDVFLNSPFNSNSQSNRVSISSYGSILFTAGDRVKLAYQDGRVIDLVGGLHPLWFEDDKNFFYYDHIAQSLLLCDLSSQEKKILIEGVKIVSPIVLSPDKKQLAYFKRVPVQTGGDIAKFGEKNCLEVITVDGWSKKEISSYRKSIIEDNSRVDWTRSDRLRP